jgi:hypothetical protein
LRAVVETDITQANMKHWLELDEDDPGFQLLTQEEIAAVIIFYLFSSALPKLLNIQFICFPLSFILCVETILCIIHIDYGLIRMTPN